MIACAGAAYWMLTDDRFSIAAPQVTGGVSYTDLSALLTAAGVGDGQHPNVVRLRTSDMASAMMSFPALADAQVTTALPNTVTIDLSERVPVFALQRDGSLYLVDAGGLVLAVADPAQASALGLPLVDDTRTQAVSAVDVGGQIDPIDLAAILQLGALTPADLDSAAASLALAVGDDEGFVLVAQPSGWRAIFGMYTPNLRPTDLIPRQVQCLRSLLGAGERDVSTIYLAPLDERCGTYVPVETARNTPAPATPH